MGGGKKGGTNKENEEVEVEVVGRPIMTPGRAAWPCVTKSWWLGELEQKPYYTNAECGAW